MLPELHRAALQGRIGRISPGDRDRLAPILLAGGEPACEATPLHCAAAWGPEAAVARLLAAGAAVDGRSRPDGLTALHLAAMRGDAGIARALIGAGADPGAVDALGRNVVEHAVHALLEFPSLPDGGSVHLEVEPLRPQPRVDLLRFLLGAGARVPDDDRNRGRILDASGRDLRRVLLEAMVASPTPSVLLAAAEDGHADLLDRAAAGGGIQEAYGRVLVRMEEGGSLGEVAAFLRGRGADPSAELHEAARRGNPATVAGLLREGAAPDHPSPDGSTPLQVAQDFDRVEVVRLLLGAGADPGRRNPDGSRPLHVAARRGSEELLRVLLERGVDVEAADASGQTALHVAVLGRHEACALLLLDAGADPRRRRSSPFGEESPIDLAREAGLADLASRMERP